jgi:CHASE3 domain sensor protein
MKMTIGMKLGLAFLVVIGLMVLSGGVAYFNVAAMNTSLSGVLDESIPTVRACERLMSRLDRTVAAARGYLIFADDKELAAAFLQERKNAWKEVDAEFNKLNGFAAEWHEARDRQLLEDIRREFTALQETFRKILDVAESADNVPARKTLVTQAAPRAAEMVAALSAGIDRQARQAPSDQQQKTMLALSGVVQTFAASFADLQIFVLTNDAAFKQAYEKWWNLHEEAFQTARSITVEWSAAERADWDRFVQLRGEFISLAAAMIAQRESPRANLAEYYMETESPKAGRRRGAANWTPPAGGSSRRSWPPRWSPLPWPP